MIDIYNFIGASVLTSSFTRKKHVHRHVPSFGTKLIDLPLN